jgi:hypothetical protein
MNLVAVEVVAHVVVAPIVIAVVVIAVDVVSDVVIAVDVVAVCVFCKALHSELLAELSSWFLSQNKFFAIFKFRVEHHFFCKFWKVWKFQISKIAELFLNFPNFFQTFTNFLTQKQGFLLDFKFLVVFLKFSKFTYNFS